MASLDLLNCADVEIHKLSELFLSDFLGHPLPAQIGAENFDLSSLFGVDGHTPY